MKNREEMIVEIVRMLETADSSLVEFIYYLLLQYPRNGEKRGK